MAHDTRLTSSPLATERHEASSKEGTPANDRHPASGVSPFPLGVTPFERYMLVDERAGYPMTIAMEFLFEGSVDVKRLERAARQTLRCHPMLSGRVTSRRRNGSWRDGDGPDPLIMWVSREALARPVGREIQPMSDPPLQLRATRNDRGFLLQLVAHHAASDGLGLLRFVTDLILSYDGIVGVRGTDLQSLRGRGTFAIELPEPISKWTAAKFLGREASRFLFRKVRRLQSDVAMSHFNAKADHDDKGTGPRAMRTVQLPAELARILIGFSRTHGVSFNDLCIAALFQAVQQFASSAADKHDRWIRIVLPVSLRTRKDRPMPAANMIGYAFLDRRESECGDLRQLMTNVSDEISLIRRWSMAAPFVDAVRSVDRVPGALFAASRLISNSATIVCSNLGDIQRHFRRRATRSDAMRTLTLRLATGVAPVRPGTGAALGIGQVGEHVCLAMSRDAQRFSTPDADRLLLQLVGCLSQFVGFDHDSTTAEVRDGLAYALD